MKKMHYVALAALSFVWAIQTAPTDKPDEALAKESETYCASTAQTKATPDLIKKKVNEAVKLLEEKCHAAYSSFHGKGSPFLFAGTYIWLNDLNGIMLLHPIKPGLVGKELLGLKDGNGKRFFLDLITVAKEKGEGWISYTWPKPGEKTRSLKVSFAKLAVIENDSIMVGCGTYDLTEEEVEALTKN